ncbi:hypothetical protein [Nonomuraea jabiensis]|uniref:hypothetical protein n=1 Tax=Nonomuraea jabiensis TaxID=882448 RepID=UPI003697374C
MLFSFESCRDVPVTAIDLSFELAPAAFEQCISADGRPDCGWVSWRQWAIGAPTLPHSIAVCN